MRLAPLSGHKKLLVVVAIGLAIAIGLVAWRFQTDLDDVRTRVVTGSRLVATPCGTIEYQEISSGLPLLAVHGSGGGYEQGTAFARP